MMREYFAFSSGLVASALMIMIVLLRVKIRDLEIRIDNLKRELQEK
jgi:hypothetical protein